MSLMYKYQKPNQIQASKIVTSNYALIIAGFFRTIFLAKLFVLLLMASLSSTALGLPQVQEPLMQSIQNLA